MTTKYNAWSGIRSCTRKKKFLLLKTLFIYLATLGLIRYMWDLFCLGWDLSLWFMNSLVVAQGLSCSIARGILVSPLGIKLKSFQEPHWTTKESHERFLNSWLTEEVRRKGPWLHLHFEKLTHYSVKKCLLWKGVQKGTKEWLDAEVNIDQ